MFEPLCLTIYLVATAEIIPLVYTVGGLSGMLVKCAQSGQKRLCLRLSRIVKSIHLHNNEVGSEAIGRVCLPPNCAHVLMDSVRHYFADPNLSLRPQLQRNGDKCMCLSLSTFISLMYGLLYFRGLSFDFIPL